MYWPTIFVCEGRKYAPCAASKHLFGCQAYMCCYRCNISIKRKSVLPHMRSKSLASSIGKVYHKLCFSQFLLQYLSIIMNCLSVRSTRGFVFVSETPNISTSVAQGLSDSSILFPGRQRIQREFFPSACITDCKLDWSYHTFSSYISAVSTASHHKL